MPRKEYTAEERAGATRLGAAVAAARTARNLSRNEVARSTGVSPEHIQKIESGQVPGVGFVLIARIAETVNVGLEELVRAGTPVKEKESV